MGKRDYWIVGMIVVMASALVLLSPLMRGTAAQDEVIIRVNGAEYAHLPLNEAQTVTIRQESGAVNVVEITGTGVRMQASTCDNQRCVHGGEVTRDNWETRAEGAFIICLPNRVSVELAVSP